jgi:flagellar hook-length control protein FliK
MPAALNNLPAAPSGNTGGTGAPGGAAAASTLLGIALNAPAPEAGAPGGTGAQTTAPTSILGDFLQVLVGTISANPAAEAAALPQSSGTAPAPDSPGHTPSGGADPSKDKPEDLASWLAQMLMPPAAAPIPMQAAPQTAPSAHAEPAASTPAQSGGVSALDVLKLLEGTVAASSDAQASPLPTPPLHSSASPEPTSPTPDGASTAPVAAAPVPGIGHAAAPHVPAPTEAAVLRTPVSAAGWREELGAHLTWMAHKGIESGSLQVTPPDLGPIEVRIAVHDAQASVWFGAAHADTRAALEQALPRLRELFASQGLALADAGVFREPPRQQQPPPGAPTSSEQREVDGTRSVSATPQSGIGLIDLYA